VVVIIVSWVLFRCETLPDAISYIAAMFGLSHASVSNAVPIAGYASRFVLVSLCAGVLLATPAVPYVLGRLQTRSECYAPKHRTFVAMSLNAGYLCLLTVIFVVSMSRLAAGTYNPFIYFRF